MHITRTFHVHYAWITCALACITWFTLCVHYAYIMCTLRVHYMYILRILHVHYALYYMYITRTCQVYYAYISYTCTLRVLYMSITRTWHVHYANITCALRYVAVYVGDVLRGAQYWIWAGAVPRPADRRPTVRTPATTVGHSRPTRRPFPRPRQEGGGSSHCNNPGALNISANIFPYQTFTSNKVETFQNNQTRDTTLLCPIDQIHAVERSVFDRPYWSNGIIH